MNYPKLSHEKILKRLSLPGREKVLDIIIDSDTYNAVDDQYAIAWLLRSEERVRVQAVYAAPFSQAVFKPYLQDHPTLRMQYLNDAESTEEGMINSYNEMLRVFELMKIPSEGRVFRGSATFLPDRDTPVISDAAKDLVSRAMARDDDDPLYIVAIGAITNVASAILLEPRIVQKTVLIWLAGEPLGFPNARDFNSGQDLAASQIIFDSGIPLVMVPNAAVAFTLTVSLEELQHHLSGKNAIADYLVEMLRRSIGTEAQAAQTVNASLYYMRKFFMPDMNDLPEEMYENMPVLHSAWTQRICDLAAASYVINPAWSLSRIVKAPRLLDNMDYDNGDPERHPMREVTYMSRDAVYGDMFYKLGRKERRD